MKAAEEALLITIQIDFGPANGELENASSLLVKRVLAELSLKKALDDVLYSNIENWAHSSSFIDVFSLKALSSTHFKHPVQG